MTKNFIYKEYNRCAKCLKRYPKDVLRCTNRDCPGFNCRLRTTRRAKNKGMDNDKYKEIITGKPVVRY